jgi:hypothetical protein
VPPRFLIKAGRIPINYCPVTHSKIPYISVESER